MKYIIILIFILILFNFYYSYKCSKNYEKFTDLTPEQLKVITNLSPHLIGIKNLSDLATQLMTGNLTVPGGLLINGDITVKGKSQLSNDVLIDGNLNVSKLSTLNDLNASKSSTLNDTTIIKNFNVNGKTTLNDDTNILTSLSVGNNINLNKDLNVLGKTILGKNQRQYMHGGTYHLRAYGARMQLFNGWNFVWQDHGWTEGFRRRVQWNGSSSQKYFHYTFGNDMRLGKGDDVNWMPRYLTILPGFKAKLYYNINSSTMGDVTRIYTEGEYDLAPYNNNTNESNRVIHAIALALVEEDLPLKNNIDLALLKELVN